MAHKPCLQAAVCKVLRRSLSSCLEPEFLRLVLCDFSLRPVWTCPRTKVAPRLSCSARTEPPGDKLDFGRKSCVTLPHSFSWPPSRQPRQCTYTEKRTTDGRRYRQPGIVRRMARWPTIHIVGALFVTARTLVCVTSMRPTCGFVFLDKKFRVAQRAPLRLT